MGEFKLYRVVDVNEPYWDPDTGEKKWLGRALVEVAKGDLVPKTEKLIDEVLLPVPPPEAKP